MITTKCIRLDDSFAPSAMKVASAVWHLHHRTNYSKGGTEQLYRGHRAGSDKTNRLFSIRADNRAEPIRNYYDKAPIDDYLAA